MKAAQIGIGIILGAAMVAALWHYQSYSLPERSEQSAGDSSSQIPGEDAPSQMLADTSSLVELIDSRIEAHALRGAKVKTQIPPLCVPFFHQAYGKSATSKEGFRNELKFRRGINVLSDREEEELLSMLERLVTASGEDGRFSLRSYVYNIERGKGVIEPRSIDHVTIAGQPVLFGPAVSSYKITWSSHELLIEVDAEDEVACYSHVWRQG